MLIEKIRSSVLQGMVIPKPEAKAAFLIKGWGTRRDEPALIYTIPNHKNSAKPFAKGITISEFDKSFAQLTSSGNFTRIWFNANLPKCAKEGSCNFTSIGGIFAMLGLARYSGRGMYERI